MSSGPTSHATAEPLRCPLDGRQLEPVADAPDTRACPECGRRTDTPGSGTLDDGFDVVANQWGLRGDPHVWSAMRAIVATTPTPATEREVRAAYVAALRNVTDVDIDHSEEALVFREELDHGGMSGGTVDLNWWRSTGIPLLVARAVTRRPLTRSAAPPPRRQSVVGTIVVWMVVMAIPAALIGGGVWLLYQQISGTRVRATVLDCDLSGGRAGGASTYRQDCIASWTIDGEEFVGGFSGGNGDSDVGRTVDASVRGDTAYSRSLRLPIVLIAIGLPFLLVPLLPRLARRGAS